MSIWLLFVYAVAMAVFAFGGVAAEGFLAPALLSLLALFVGGLWLSGVRKPVV